MNPRASFREALGWVVAAGIVLGGCTRSEFRFEDVGIGGHVEGEVEGLATERYVYRGTADSRVRLGSRSHVKSVLEEGFGPLAAPVVDQYIMKQPGYFGGPCDPMVDPGNFLQGTLRRVASCNSRSDSQALVVSTSVPGREALRVQACEEIALLDGAIRYAATLALGGTPGDALLAAPGGSLQVPDDTLIRAAAALFSPARKLADESLASLREVVAGARGLEGVQDPALEAWRYLFLTLCREPHWQIP